MQKTVLILGARGRFGLAAARAFAHAGWRVLAQCRADAKAPTLAGVRWLALDLQDPALLQAAQGAGVVLHALNPPYTLWETQALPLLDDAIALACALQATLMLPGNVYNFGQTMPDVLREDTAQLAHTRKGKIRIAMEQRLQQMSESGPLRSVVIRAGDFFGSGTGSWFDLALAKDLRKGQLTYPGPWDVTKAWAYLPDLAASFEQVARCALEQPQRLARFEVLHFKGHDLNAVHWAQVLEPLAREQGWLGATARLRHGALPWWLFNALGWAVPLFRELAEMRYLWLTPHSLANAKLSALMGKEARTPLAQAARAALVELGLIAAEGAAKRP